ncbi:MAG: M56 family metallopeptidase [Calothrix sp. SM1_7_51]|nr:M56 family metallopeptidase [Calothrix sp. SM1_7_51]
MHLVMVLAGLIIAWFVRTRYTELTSNIWGQRWRLALFTFLFPPLLILMTAVALVCMGPQGKMGNWQTGCLGYVLALIYLIISCILLIKLAWKGWQLVKTVRECPVVNITGKQIRLLDTEALFAGQIGFWQPELVLSYGLIQNLDEIHLESVLAHEQGHYYYRDTFWFFWLGWMRNCSAWLPNTDALWQELLVLRELRADARAALQVDPLIIAESLLIVVSSQSISEDIFCAAVDTGGSNRLEQRIEALLSPAQSTPESSYQYWNLFLLALSPLITVIFHY